MNTDVNHLALKLGWVADHTAVVQGPAAGSPRNLFGIRGGLRIDVFEAEDLRTGLQLAVRRTSLDV
jgi:hypothetical protein